MGSEAASASSEARETSAWGPVSAQERILTLDALRGVAVLGILLANILLFARPAISLRLVGEQGTASDQLTAFLLALFVEGKFYTLFSILFGMGLALQSRRAAERKSAFTAVYLRRLLVLLLIGVTHALLFFHADILSFYAVVALLALPFRNASEKILLRWAVVVYGVGLVVLGAYVIGSPTGSMPMEPEWGRLYDSLALDPRGTDEAAVPPSLSGTLVPLVTRGMSRNKELRFYAFMADEERIFRSGTWSEMIRHRAINFFLVGMPLKLLFVSWRVLAFFLLGMFFVHRGLFVDDERRGGAYTQFLVSGFVIGMFLQFAGGMAQGIGRGHIPVVTLGLFGIMAGTVAVALSYAGGVALLCSVKPSLSVIRALASVGRLALSNYLMQSIICGFVFYSYGLGWFGRLGRAEAVALAVPIYALQIVWSGLWLRSFRFGPSEWLWRTLTYGRAQPMRWRD